MQNLLLRKQTEKVTISSFQSLNYIIVSFQDDDDDDDDMLHRRPSSRVCHVPTIFQHILTNAALYCTMTTFQA
jgi:hypothetical protein